MKTYQIILGIVAMALLICLADNFSDMPGPGARQNYKNGEILLPDYAHTDTLTVIDSEGLNAAMEDLQPATDQEISDILYRYCR